MNVLLASISSVLGMLVVLLLIYWKLKGPVASLVQKFRNEIGFVARNFDAKLGDLRAEIEPRFQTHLHEELTKTREELVGAMQRHVTGEIERLKKEIGGQQQQDLAKMQEEFAGAIQTHVAAEMARLNREVVSQLQQDLTETEEKLVAAVQTQVASATAQLKKDLVARTGQRLGGLYNTDLLKPFVNISASGQKSLDEARFLEHAWKALEPVKGEVSVSDGLNRASDRYQQFLRDLDSGDVSKWMHMLTHLVETGISVLKLDVVKALSIFLKSCRARQATDQMNELVRTARSVLDFLKDERRSTVEAVAAVFSRITCAIVENGYIPAEQFGWFTFTENQLLVLLAKGRHAAYDLQRQANSLPTQGVDTILSSKALERLELLRKTANEFRETAYVAHLSMLAQLVGLYLLSLLNTSNTRIESECVVLSEYCAAASETTRKFAAGLRNLLGEKMLRADFGGQMVEGSRKGVLQLVATLLTEMDEVAKNAAAAIGRVRELRQIMLLPV